MATHTVKPAQNIYDVALHLYGSVEGLFDLLITNDWLSMNTELTEGMELEYHDYFVINDSIVEQFASDNIVPANDAREVYYKSTQEELVFFVDCAADLVEASMEVCGGGTMVIDWGDNSSLQIVVLNSTVRTVTHSFDTEVDARRIKVYGQFELEGFDSSGLNGTMYLVQPLYVGGFRCDHSNYPLDSMALFEGTYSVTLKGGPVTSLLPLGDMGNLHELDLREASMGADVFEEYLTYIVNNYGTRSGCLVYLNNDQLNVNCRYTMSTILNEESWNTPNAWMFIVDGIPFQPVRRGR